MWPKVAVSVRFTYIVSIFQGVNHHNNFVPEAAPFPDGSFSPPLRCAAVWARLSFLSQAKDRRFRLTIHFFQGGTDWAAALAAKAGFALCLVPSKPLRNVGLDIPHLLQVNPASLVCSYSFTQTSRFFSSRFIRWLYQLAVKRSIRTPQIIWQSLSQYPVELREPINNFV